jgi:hypothetical protein
MTSPPFDVLVERELARMKQEKPERDWLPYAQSLCAGDDDVDYHNKNELLEYTVGIAALARLVAEDAGLVPLGLPLSAEART